MDKYNILIFDTYNLIFKASFIENERTVELEKTKYHVEGIIGFLKAVESYIKKFATDDVIIYWLMDNAKSSIQKYRKSLSEDYKKTRVEQPDWFYKQIDLLELILKNYRDNSFLYRVKFIEADDYTSNIIRDYVKKEDRVLLISEDSDWSRSLADNVHQYCEGEILTKELFYKKNGYEATYSNICFHKVFYGDKTDNILPTLPTLPSILFLQIIKDFNNIHTFILRAKEKNIKYLDSGWVEKIKQQEENLLLNWNLVEAIDLSSIDLKSYQTKCTFNKIKLQVLYESLSIINLVDNRIKTEKKQNDILSDLLGGIEVKRKKI